MNALTQEHIDEIKKINENAKAEMDEHERKYGQNNQVDALRIPMEHIDELLAHVEFLNSVIADQRSDSGLYEQGFKDGERECHEAAKRMGLYGESQ